MMDIMSEFYMMNVGVGNSFCFQAIFFSRKENPKANLCYGSFERGSFTSWLKILKEVRRVPLGDILGKALKSSLPCHSLPLSNSTYSDFYDGDQGVGGIIIPCSYRFLINIITVMSDFSLARTSKNIIHFLSYETLQKKKRLSLEISLHFPVNQNIC